MKKLLTVFCFFLLNFAIYANNVSDDQNNIADETVDIEKLSNPIYMLRKDKPSYKNKVGIGIEKAFVYYRRSFGISTDVFANVHLVRGLYFEGGTKFMAFKYSLTHFFPLTLNIFDNEIFGSTVGIRVGLKYYFDILEHFGLLIGNSFAMSALFIVAMDTFRNPDKLVPSVGLEMSPDVCIGATIPFGKFRFNILFTKYFPLLPVQYNYSNKSIITFSNYDDNKDEYFSLQRLYCYSAMSVSFSFIYFIK